MDALSRISGELSAGEIASHFAVTQPAISQHLKVLKQCHLVTDRAEGTRRIYRVDPAGVAAMRDYLDQMWDKALAAFALATQNDDTTQPKGQDE